MEITEIAFLLVSIIITVIINSLVVWLAGKSLVGSEKAKFTDATWIVILGSVIGGALNALVSGILGTVIVILLWLLLIKHFFDCGWGKALLIAIIAAIILVIIGFILGLLLGVTIFTLGI
jgi:hypothetical protein